MRHSHSTLRRTRYAEVNVEVSRVSAKAKEMIEAMGGSVVKVHYNRLGIRALLKPEKFPLGLPKPARTPIFLKAGDGDGTRAHSHTAHPTLKPAAF